MIGIENGVMKKLIFVTYGGGHVAMMVPVIKKMLSFNCYNIVVIALTTAGSVLDREGISSLGYKDFTDLANDRWVSYGHELLDIVLERSPLISHEESLAYYGINFLELVESYGYESALSLFQEKGRHAFFPIKFFEKVLSVLKPDLVVATNSPRSERAAIQAAGLLDIKSLCLVDMFALQEYQFLAKSDYATKIGVLNCDVKDFLVSKGRAESDIVVTGNPAFDRIFDKSLKVLADVLKEDLLEQVPHKKIILFASQIERFKHPFEDVDGGDIFLPIKIEHALREFVSNREQYHLVVRYHPSENTKFEPAKNVSLSLKSDNLHVLIHAVDLVIVTASTVGLEAYLAGKPVISVDNSIWTKDAPYSQMGISYGVPSVDALPNAIESIFQGSYAPKLDAEFEKIAADRVVSLVIDLCKPPA